MKFFNAIQIVVLLMLAPTLLTLARAATFAGAGALFWGGLAGTLALAVFAMVCIYEGLDS